jgi:hypothetical protein
MATSKIKGLDEPTLEGGIGSGAGGRSGVTSYNSKLDNVFGIEGKALSKSKPKKEDEIKEVPMDIKGAVEAAEKYQAKYGTKSFPRRPSRDEREQDAKERQYEKYSGKDLNYRGGKSETPGVEGMKKGGAVTASRRADGIAMRGKTRGKMC